MLSLRSRVCLLIALFLSLTTFTFAQKPETLAQFGKGPHLGPAEDALIGLEVTFQADGSEPILRYGNGFLLRCDGFVLVPASLFVRPAELANKDYTGSVRVTIHPGTEQARRVTTTLPRKTSTNVRYTVIKLPDVHIPAVQTLLPDGLETGDTLEVVWSAYDAAAKRFLPPQKRSLPLGKKEPVTAQTQGTRVLTEALNGVPVGAIILGSETLAVGMVTPSPSARFATLESLDQVTNCVTPLPMTEAEFARKREMLAALAERSPREKEEELPRKQEEEVEQPPDPSPGMVKVPGGPVRLTPGLLSAQKDMGHATTACVAPFLIDRYEVTNGQYLAFWKAMAEKTKRDARLYRDLFPIGWADSEPYFPDDLAGVPVLGVNYEGAKAYARWVGKRLPTPYEWSLAAFGPTGGNVLPDWAKKYVADRQRTWQEVVEAHLNYLNNNPPLLEQYKISLMKLRGIIKNGWKEPSDPKQRLLHPVPYSEPSAREYILPWYFYRNNLVSAVAWSKNTVLNTVAPLFQTYKSPQHVLATGVREFDVSPYGAHDMALNAFEVVCPSPDIRMGGIGAYYMRMQWTLPPIWDISSWERLKRGETPFVPWFECFYYRPIHLLSDILLLSRRLRSTTSNAGHTVVWSHQQPRTVAASNLYEIVYMLPPISGWEVLLTQGPTTMGGPISGFPGSDSELDIGIGAIFPTGAGGGESPLLYYSTAARSLERQYHSSAFMLWDEAASYPLWSGKPKYFVQEMGRPYDTDVPEGRNLPKLSGSFEYQVGGITDTYLVPGGFRCVR